MAAIYPPFSDTVVQQAIATRWTYRPVSYINGDLVPISTASLPLSGVNMSEVMRGAGEFRASLQLADPSVQVLYPWDKIIPRKTGIVAIREQFDSTVGDFVFTGMQHYIVWAAPRHATSGRMDIFAQTVESLWARRKITKAISWAQADQTSGIAADLLDPTKWSKIPLGVGQYTGWINVDPPGASGVLRDFSYLDGQETNLLTAHQDRSQLATNSYEWRTAVRVLTGTGPLSATSYRLQYVMGFPTLGRSIDSGLAVPRFRFSTAGNGNVVDYEYQNDGSQVTNIVWGRGNGYEDAQLKAQVQYTDTFGRNEWDYGFLQTEGLYSNPDDKESPTLIAHCLKQMYQSLSSETFISSLQVNGNTPPYFHSYTIGDGASLVTNDLTWPPGMKNSDGYVELGTRIFGWVVTPLQGKQNEQVNLLVAGGSL